MAEKLGPKALQIRALRERRAMQAEAASKAERLALAKKLTEAPASKPQPAPVKASAQPKERPMSKKRTAKAVKKTRKARQHPAIKSVTSADHKTTRIAKKAATPSGGVPARDVGDFICRDGGCTMAELEKNFGIEAHPMRAKIHYAKHKLGYDIKHDGERYSGTAPKAA